MLELLLSRWQLEMPGIAAGGKAADDAVDPRRPLLGQIDLGFLGRMFTGGLAAVVVLMIVVAATDNSDKALENAAAADLSIGWAIGVGSASTAAWQWVGRVVEARMGAAADAMQASYEALKSRVAALEQTGQPGFEQQTQSVVFAETRGELVGVMKQLEVAARRLGRDVTS